MKQHGFNGRQAQPALLGEAPQHHGPAQAEPLRPLIESSLQSEVEESTGRGLAWPFILILLALAGLAADGPILELGCGHGDLLACLNPSKGVGIDFSENMLRAAAEKHPVHLGAGLSVHRLGPAPVGQPLG